MVQLPTPQNDEGKPRRLESVAEQIDNGKRLDAFLSARLPEDLSRTRIKSLISEGQARLNGQVCDQPNYRMRVGDRVLLYVPAPTSAIPQAEAISLDILYEDECIIVINKPAGLVVHPAPGNRDGTLVNALIHHCGDGLRGIGGQRRPGIVHRLDRDTSGVMVVAKTQIAHSRLTRQFADHGRKGPLERSYVAIAWGEFEHASGTVDAALGRSDSNRIKRAVVRAGRTDAREAITHFRVIAGLDGNGDGAADASMVECRLETGRTHQIRVHLSHIGHPLIGDSLYGAHFRTKANTLGERQQKAVNEFARQALHAATLGFSHPETGKSMRFEAPLPDDIAELVAVFDRVKRSK